METDTLKNAGTLSYCAKELARELVSDITFFLKSKRETYIPFERLSDLHLKKVTQMMDLVPAYILKEEIKKIGFLHDKVEKLVDNAYNNRGLLYDFIKERRMSELVNYIKKGTSFENPVVYFLFKNVPKRDMTVYLEKVWEASGLFYDKKDYPGRTEKEHKEAETSLEEIENYVYGRIKERVNQAYESFEIMENRRLTTLSWMAEEYAGKEKSNT